VTAPRETPGFVLEDAAIDAIARRLLELSQTRLSVRFALSREEAAHALGVSLSHFERHVQPELRLVYSGRLRLVPLTEIERWVAESAVRSA
jgi:excisionase family DNA binding protein